MTNQELSNIATEVLDKSSSRIHESVLSAISSNTYEGQSLGDAIGCLLPAVLKTTISEAVGITLTTLIQSGMIHVDDD